MSRDNSRTRRARALLVLPFVAAIASLTWTPVSAQTAAPGAAPPEVQKSKRLDKHAPPWEVIWNNRLWTEVPETKDFVKATHPNPKSLEYAPLVGKDPERPKPRDAAGIAALQAELEGDVKRNEARGKAINDVGAPPKTPKKAKAARAKSRQRKTGHEKTAKAATSRSSTPD